MVVGMTKKQKKMNRMTDMSVLTKRHSEDYFERLQKSRIFRMASPQKLKTRVSASLQPVIEKISEQVKKIEQVNLLPANFQSKKWFSERLTIKSVNPIIIFVIVSLVMLSAFPLLHRAEKDRKSQAAVLGAATSAYEELMGAKSALFSFDFDAANIGLASAYGGFEEAIKNLNNLSLLAASVPAVESGGQLLMAAQDATLGIQYLTSGLQSFSELKISSFGFESGSQATLDESFQKIGNDFDIASRYIDNSLALISNLDVDSLPQDLAQQATVTHEQLLLLSGSLESIDAFQELFFALLVTSQPKKYLVLFQNNRELRATGGFIGTVGLLALHNGKIDDFNIETVYNPDGQLSEHIAPPGPLTRNLTDNWGLRDSNWFFDFPKSAQKAADFYELETGTKVDGVFAFTPEIFVKLLALTGPVAVPGYDVVLTSENFVDEVQYQTSVAYDRKLNQPKRFLADFTPIFLDRLGAIGQEDWFDMFGILIQSLSGKDIQLFSFDENLQSRFQDFSWDGGVKQTAGDYLSVVNTNVGAGKTDQNISQSISLETEMLKDGTHKNRLTISRTHTPGNETEFPINVDFVRIFVPEKSVLISSTGFDNFEFYPSIVSGARQDSDLSEIDSGTKVDAVTNTLIYNESGKTVFANWLSLPPGETRTVTLEYITPDFANPDQNGLELYSLLVQKQSGAPKTELNITLKFTDDKKPVIVKPEESAVYDDKVEMVSGLVTDEIFGVIFEKD